MEFETCIDFLNKQLSMPLPGEDAQYKMAPMKRKSRVEKYASSPDAKHSSVLLLLYPENKNTN
ncbi:MAG: hypothetical protein KJO64_04500, partial [Bacteroidia bacterium]|nr:hypothetical protein [Bacteroidia bacterium]